MAVHHVTASALCAGLTLETDPFRPYKPAADAAKVREAAVNDKVQIAAGLPQ